jgi:hypothetical protein
MTPRFAAEPWTRRARLWTIALVAIVAACGDPAPGIKTGTTVDTIGLDVLFGGFDSATDIGNPFPTDSMLTDLSEVTPPDTANSCEFAPEPGVGEPGSPCKTNGDCNANICVEGPDGKICSRQCQDCCPSGYLCAQVGDGDVSFACVPKMLHLCSPCVEDSECAVKGDDALCIAYGGAGRFCGGSCTVDKDCPGGYQCLDAMGSKGQSKQCVLQTGVCACSKKAIGTGASTVCSVSNSAGTCSGTRKCGADGLSACDAPVPASETCGNAIDDDCNGKTDEVGALGCTVLWLDGDQDGFGLQESLGGKSQCLCSPVDLYTSQKPTDCNDAKKEVSPAQPELCNDIDDNCQGGTDEGCDDDNDGYCDLNMTIVGKPSVCPNGDKDCNDVKALIHPGAVEICGNGIDDDCNGAVDDGDSATGCKTFYLDADKDGFGTADGKCTCAAVGMYTALTTGDCNDNDVTVNPAAIELCGNGKDDNCKLGQDEENSQGCAQFWVDADSDGYGSVGPKCLCAPDTDYTVKKGGDCNDAEPKQNPGLPELCNGSDDDCDGQTDEPDALGCVVYYTDKDGDGWGDPNAKACLCAPNAKYSVPQGGDCDDGKPKANPAQKELCDGYDNNCDGAIDEQNAFGCNKFYIDGDGDGYGPASSEACLCVMTAPYNTDKGSDCNDAAVTVHPGATELCNGIDDDCSGQTDEENAKGCGIYLFDDDGDGYGQDGKAKCLCGATKPYAATTGGDCNDTNPAIKPGATEVCDSVDNNCDGKVDEQNAAGCTTFYVDTDKDGYGTPLAPALCICAAAAPYTATVSGDCNDTDPGVFPKQIEVCNGKDDDCNAIVDDLNAVGCKTFFEDDDSDGFGQSGSAQCACEAKGKFTASKTGDCNDGNPSVHPGAIEVCNYADDDCNGITDSDSPDAKTYYVDNDNDGYGTGGGTKLCAAAGAYKVLTAGDCNDGSAATHPGASETCNNVDDNCNGQIDEGAATNLCPSVPNGTPQCVSGKCSPVCNGKSFDIDGLYINGCECSADGNYGVQGGACTGAIDLGNLADDGSTVQKVGNIVPGEAGDWYRFHATDSPDTGGACDKFNVKAKIVGNPDGQFALDLYRGGCAGANQLCAAQTDSGWNVNTGGAPPYGPTTGKGSTYGGGYAVSPSPEVGGECNCTGAPGVPGMNVCTDNTADFFIRVYRLAGAPATCSTYTVQFSNGL